MIKKVEVRGLIEALTEILNSGIEYINMTLEKENHQDSILFTESSSKEIVDNQKDTNIVNFEDLI